MVNPMLAVSLESRASADRVSLPLIPEAAFHATSTFRCPTRARAYIASFEDGSALIRPRAPYGKKG